MSPFGYNPMWETWKCPLCKNTFHFRLKDQWEIESAERTKLKHSEWHKENDPQKRLYSGPFVYTSSPTSSGFKKTTKREVSEKDMKIPSTYIEPSKGKTPASGLPVINAGNLEAKLGDSIHCTITGPIEQVGEFPTPEQVAQGQKTNVFYSAPVDYVFRNKKGRGQYSINQSTAREIAKLVGDETDAWVGVSFDAFCQMVRNPRKGTQQLGFTIINSSAKKA